MAGAGVILGLVMLYRAATSVYALGPDKNSVMNLCLGAICVFGSGINRRMYLSDAGIIREMNAWGRVSRQVVPWESVKHVSLAFRRDKMMAFFEVDVKGWKVLFSRNQERVVRDILNEMLYDDVSVNVIEGG
jgi:hypothetical protein